MFPQSSNPSSLGKYYLFIVPLVAVILAIAMLTAYNNGLLQLGQFGEIYLGFLILGFIVWLFKMYVFHQDDEPSASKLILSGFAVTAGLFSAAVGVSVIAKVSTLSFLQTGAVLTLGHGYLAPLATASTNTPDVILTLLMNVPAPVAETGFFIVFLCSCMLGAFQIFSKNNPAGKTSPTSKLLIVVIVAVTAGWFHAFAYSWSWLEMIAAMVAFGIMAFYYVFISASVLVTTVAHFLYNFIILFMSIVAVTPALTSSAGIPSSVGRG